MDKFAISFEHVYNGTTADFYKNRLLQVAEELGLTIAGRNFPPVRRGVSHCSKGNLLTVGSAKTHDVEWIERLGYAAEKGIPVIFDGVKEYNQAVKEMTKYAEKKYGYRLTSGVRVTFHKGFVKVGHIVIPNSELYKVYVLSRVRNF